MTMQLSGFESHALDERHMFFTGELPGSVVPDVAQVEELWNLHPAENHRIKMHGRLVETPRWQQAYGKDYHYTGRTNKALPMLVQVRPILAWAKEVIDDRLNGALVNWYDARRGHYIGPHRDSRKNMVCGTPIITVSLGDARTFRLRPWKGSGYTDFSAEHADVFITPFATNLAYTHEVPKSRRCTGRRISVTLRAFTV